MTRITVDVDDELLAAARHELGTTTKVATINEALRAIAWRKKAADIIAVMNNADMDFTGSEKAWRYGGGRDLSKLEEKARQR